MNGDGEKPNLSEHLDADEWEITVEEIPYRKRMRGWIAKRMKNNLTASRVERQGWPKFWNLLSFILPGDVREKVYEPAMVHLLKDYDRRVEYSGKWERGWIHFCFVVRTLLLAVDCLRCLRPSRFVRFLMELFLGK